MWPEAWANMFCGTAHAVKPNRKETFCLQLVGFLVNVADLFVFAGTNCENPVPESGTKILTLKLGPYILICLDDFWLKYYPFVL